jgi:tricorn protease
VAEPGYLRFPHIHDDLLTFVAEGDVWLAPVAGGRAWRLSAGDMLASNPRLSRDGTLVAWTGRKDGAAEVYLTPADGGVTTQLTYWGDSRAQVCGWSPDGEVLAVSSAGQPFRNRSWAYAIRTEANGDGPRARQLPFGPVTDLAMEPSGTALLTGALGEPAWWKRYRGGTAGRMWLSTAGTGEPAPFRRTLADLGSHLASPMLIGGRLAFLSDHEGTANIYSVAPDGSDLRRHTDHDGSYARHASTDGERIVYCCRGELWLLDGLDAAAPQQVPVNLGSALAGRAPRLITAGDHLGSLSCDRTGQASVVEVRGTVHWLTHRDGPARALAVAADVRARLPQVLGQDGLAVWATDADGADALEIGGTYADGAAVPVRRLAVGAIGQPAMLAAAPDGSKVAVAARDGNLRVVDAGSGAVTELASSANGEITGVSWSRDSAWLAWSEPAQVTGDIDLASQRKIRLASLATGQVLDATDGRFSDTDPVFCGDGKYLAFLSVRSFDPVYDAHAFDLSFPYGARPYLQPLAAATPSPFAPLPAGRPIGEDKGKQDGGGDDGAADGKVAITVDPDGLAGRVVPLPVPEARYASLRAVGGGLAWLREPLTGNLGESGARLTDDPPRPALERFDFRRQDVQVLQEQADWFEVSGDGSRLVAADGGSLAVLPADRKADPGNPDDRVEVDRARARFLADPAALWRHALAEAGRLMAHDFWVPDMAEVDWPAVLAEYAPLLDRVAIPDDFCDLLWEVFGELGCSHAYVIPAGGYNSRSPVGALGADLARDGAGWRVTRVVPGESSDPRARSPLAGPGAQVQAGDLLLAVDGRPVGADGPGPLLVGTAGKAVQLTVADAAGGGTRQVVVTPLNDEYRLRYQDWVASRRARTRELSDGRLGYVHVTNMMSLGWADFHRDLRQEIQHDGLIVDVRSNGGGHTSELVVEKLVRRVAGWDMRRGMQAASYPVDARRGPMVALADEWAGSDGDIVTAAIKQLGLGPVVGARTWGGVIGYDYEHDLVDGTSMTVPRLSFWFNDLGWGVENYGVDPDVEVLITPDDWAAGRDPQLDTAVRMALDALREHPPARPPDVAGRPSRARPLLPPRPGS